MRRDIWGVLTAGLMVAGCSGGGTDPGEPEVSRSDGEAFCEILEERSAELDAAVANAGDSLGDQFLLILSNVSEFTRLLHELEDVAPEEIASDMELAVESWDSQADAISKVASDPLGALGSGAVNAVFSSASLAAVDEYSLSYCGLPVFGSGQLASGRQNLCPSLEPAGSGPSSPPELLDGEASYDDLESALEDLAATGTGPADAVAQLIDAVGDLDPEPAYATEAIGRLNFDSQQGTQLVAAIDAALLETCGSEVFGPDAIEELGELDPRQTTGGTRVSTRMYGTPCSSDATGGSMLSTGYYLAVGFEMVYRCDDKRLMVVDLATGEPRHVETEGSFGVQVTNAGDRLVWFERTEKPAEGLNPVLTSITLRVLPFDGSEELAHPIVVDVPGSVDASRYRVLYAYRDRILTAEDRPGDDDIEDFVVRDGEGGELTRITPEAENLYHDNSGSFAGLTNLWVIPTRSFDGILLDLATPTVIRPGADRLRTVSNGICFDRGIVTFDDGGGVAVTVTDGVPALTPISEATLDSFPSWDPFVPRPGVFVDFDNESGGLRAVDAGGRTLWTISKDVVADATFVAGWILVTNHSDEQIVVDPTTGAEASELDPAVKSLLPALAEGSVLLHDAETGRATAVINRTATDLDLAELCPR